jgi:hypothetical protein
MPGKKTPAGTDRLAARQTVSPRRREVASARWSMRSVAEPIHSGPVIDTQLVEAFTPDRLDKPRERKSLSLLRIYRVFSAAS